MAEAETGEILIRAFAPDDSIAELTGLLHRAYAALGEMGLNYTAVDQPDDVTKRRVDRGDCFVAVSGDDIVGTITVYPPGRLTVCQWYRKAGTAVFGQFAVLPERQGAGIGARLLARAERRAIELGASDLACDTAEPAAHLIDWYVRRGYRVVDHVQWEGKTYRSVVLSKPLARSSNVVPRS
jgi:GNAT superfamily N-acetyltransferase